MVENKSFFIRCDDITGISSTLERLLHWSCDNVLAIHLAVIPGTCTKEDAEQILRMVDNTGPTVEIGQHGWMHIDHETGTNRAEFGKSRPLLLQKQDILNGRNRMRELFESRFEEIFVPPFNHFTETTIKAMEDLGYGLMSSSRRTGIRHYGSTIDLPINVDIIMAYEPNVRAKPLDQILVEIDNSLHTMGYIGLLIHPEVLTDDDLETLSTIVKVLRQKYGLESKTLRLIANA